MRMADSSEGGWLTVEHYENYAVNLDFAAEREGLQNRYSLYSQPSGDHFISETSKSLSVHSRSLKKKYFRVNVLKSVYHLDLSGSSTIFRVPVATRWAWSPSLLFYSISFWALVCSLSFYNFFSSTSAQLERHRYPFSSIFGRYERAVKRIHYYTALFGNC